MLALCCWLASAAPAAEMPRAMWVWGTETWTDPAAGAALLAFCDERAIDRVYAWTPIAWSDGSRDGPVRAFLRSAHAAGIAVEALSGDPSHALEPNHARLLTFARWAVALGGPDTTQRFDGMHWDIEPYALPNYREQPERILRQYLDLTGGLIDAAAERPGFRCGFAVPFWWDAEPVVWREAELPPSFHVLHLLNGLADGSGYLAVMAYRDTPDGPNGSLRHVEAELRHAAAEAPRTRIVVGQETGKSGEGGHITFFDEGCAIMERALARIGEVLGGLRAFGGIAIHDYRAYRELRP